MNEVMTRETLQKGGLFVSSLCIGGGIFIREMLFLALFTNALIVLYPYAFAPVARIGQKASVVGTHLARWAFAGMYIVVLVPVHFVQTWFGRDPLRLKRWKANDSMFIKVNRTYSREDFERSF